MIYMHDELTETFDQLEVDEMTVTPTPRYTTTRDLTPPTP